MAGSNTSTGNHGENSRREELQQEGQQAAEKASAAASEVGAEMQEAVRQTAEDFQAAGQSILEERKQRTAAELGHFGTALKQTAGKLRDEHDDQLASYADRAAASLNRASNYLQERGPGELTSDLEQATRRQPELVLGGLFVAGLGLSRFLKASSRRRRQNPNGRSPDGASRQPAAGRQVAQTSTTRPGSPQLSSGPAGRI